MTFGFPLGLEVGGYAVLVLCWVIGLSCWVLDRHFGCWAKVLGGPRCGSFASMFDLAVAWRFVGTLGPLAFVFAGGLI